MDIIFLFLIFAREDQDQDQDEREQEESTNSNLDSAWLAQIHNFLTNILILIIRLQLCLVYLMAGVGKFISQSWLKGEALFSILKTPSYSLPLVSQNIKQGFLLRLFNYGTMFYQITWPVAVWIKNIRVLYFIAGILLHLSIAFIMGITTFGFTMMVGYIAFADPQNLKKTREFFRELVDKLASKLKFKKENLIALTIRTAAPLIILAWMLFHLFSIVDLVMPQFASGPQDSTKKYTLPYFPQVWLVFGPQIRDYHNSMHIRCGFQKKLEVTAEWIDPIDPVIQAHQHQRFSEYGYLTRALQNWTLTLANVANAEERLCQGLSASDCLDLTKKEVSTTKDFSNILSGVQEICTQEYRQNPQWMQVRHVRNYTNGKSEVRTFDPVFLKGL